MKEVYKTYKVRIYPNDRQKELLEKHFGCNRFVYNYFLDVRRIYYNYFNINLSFIDTTKLLTKLKKKEKYSFLKEVSAQSLNYSLYNLNDAYQSFFRKQSKYPKKKKKKGKNSFSLPQGISINEGRLKIAKFKEGIRINKKQVNRLPGGVIQRCTISKTSTGKYFASIVYKEFIKSKSKTGKVVGIDTGLKTLATLSDNTFYQNLQFLRRSYKKLRYLQRQLFKKQKGSNQRNKVKQKISLQHEKIANKRLDYLHKITTDIIENQDIICIEDLNISGMMKNHHLAGSFADAGLRTFYSLLEYKSNWYDRQLVKVDKFYASSKLCSNCGYKNDKLELKDRSWVCSNCNTEHDRDFNASVNILNEGLKILNEQSGCGCQSDSKQKQVESFSLEKAKKLEFS